MSEQSSAATTPRVHASVITGPAFVSPYMSVRKADTATQLNAENDGASGEWIPCPFDRAGLRAMVDSSTILPQCIRAYAANIAGYGIGVRCIDDMQEQDAAAEAERAQAEQIIERLSLEYDTKTVFEHIIEARETFGCAFMEVIRDPVTQQVRQIDMIEDTQTVDRSVQDDIATPITLNRRGEMIPYVKRFRHYRQQIGGKTVYFKEFGDPRIMDRRSGRYIEDGEPIAPEFQANEILEFAIGPQPYGEIRWRGSIIGIDGAARAEILNHNYFINGRHTPLLIFIRGGMLDQESEAKLQQYMAAIRGEHGQHGFIVLCAESTGEAVLSGNQEDRPDIELKDLSPMLQKDALFQEYIDCKRRQVQSAFLLPDLYVGYTTEFNRATAQTAKQVTEEQAFQGEREALAWILNNKLLADFGFRHIEAYFLEPDLSNPDDLFKLLTVCNNAGGLTPNKAKEIVYEQLGDQADPYPAEWGDIPLQVGQTQAAAAQAEADAKAAANTPDFSLEHLDSLNAQLEEQIAKAELQDPQLVPVMKSVRSKLVALMNRAGVEETWDDGEY